MLELWQTWHADIWNNACNLLPHMAMVIVSQKAVFTPSDIISASSSGFKNFWATSPACTTIAVDCIPWGKPSTSSQCTDNTAKYNFLGRSRNRNFLLTLQKLPLFMVLDKGFAPTVSHHGENFSLECIQYVVGYLNFAKRWVHGKIPLAPQKAILVIWNATITSVHIIKQQQ